jgi:SAM-dependent methyltransferase
MQTADGCSVQLYRRLAYCGELEPVEQWFVPGVSVLELGCGTGRHTRRMLALGACVTAVDNSAEMLNEAPPEATKVLCDIESLELSERFEVAVIASCLINHPLAVTRQAFLRVARHHLVTGGVLLVERHDPAWLSNVEIGPQGTVGEVALFVDSVRRDSKHVEISLRYSAGEDVWRQTFKTVALHKPEIESMLSLQAFGSHNWLGPRKRWVASIAK